MKNIKKMLALLLALVMVFSLSSCGMFEMQLLKGAKNMAELQSVHAELNLDMGYSVSLATGDIGMDASVNCGADIQRDPLKLMAVTEFSIFGVSGRIHSYGEMAGDLLTIGASIDGENWESRTTEGIELPDGGSASLVAAGAAKYLSSFAKAKGTEQMSSREAVRYDGSLSGKDIKEIVSITGAEEILKQLGDDFSIEMIDDELQIPMSIWLCKKSGMILKLEAQLHELAEVIMSHSLSQTLGLPEGASDRAGVEKAILSLSFSEFDALDEIQSPLN